MRFFIFKIHSAGCCFFAFLFAAFLLNTTLFSAIVIAEHLVRHGEYIVIRADFQALQQNPALVPEKPDFGPVASELEAEHDHGLVHHLVKLHTAAAASSNVSDEVPYDQFTHQTRCNQLRQEVPDILICEPNAIFKASVLPDDLKFDDLWGMKTINAPAAWDFQTGSQNVVVAVIDTGVDYHHTDLNNNIWRNADEIPVNGVDDDGNGYVDDVLGYDFANNDYDPYDDNGHGTHVAGTVGAEGNNKVGVAGASWNTSIMALKFLKGNGSGTTFGAIQAVNYAVQNGADIINASWGGPIYSEALELSILAARDAGVLFIAAAGNEGKNNDVTNSYPANYNYNNVISVAASDASDNLTSFSNYGSGSVDIAAPGLSIVSTFPGNRYAKASGTSMAAPHVAGVAALVKAHFPALSYLEIRDRIFNYSSVVSALSGKIITGKRLSALGPITGTVDPGSPGDGPVSGPPSGGNSGDSKVVKLHTVYGLKGKSKRFGKLFQKRDFELVLTGAPGASLILGMNLAGTRNEMRDCLLGTYSIGASGLLKLRGKFRAVGKMKRNRKMLFRANFSERKAKLKGNSLNTRRLRRLRIRNPITDADLTCNAIASSMRVVQ